MFEQGMVYLYLKHSILPAVGIRSMDFCNLWFKTRWTYFKPFHLLKQETKYQQIKINQNVTPAAVQ
jgi:hypothetical protein